MNIDVDLICDRTFCALENLYLNSKDTQPKYSGYYNEMSFAKEYCTVSIKSSRQVGHSLAIAKFLKKHGNGNWFVMTYNLAMLYRLSTNYIIPSIKEKYEECGEKIISTTQSHIKHRDGNIYLKTIKQIEQLRGMDLNGIIVDCASMVSQSKIDEIYRIGTPTMIDKEYKFFIFVE